MNWTKEQALRACNPQRERDMQTVRDAMYAFGDIELLSIRTGISKSALHAIRSGRTQWPRWVTLYSLMAVLGLELSIHRKGER